MKTRVLIVEPSQIIVEGLVHMLQDKPNIKLLSPEYNLQYLQERIVAGKPDVMLVNANMAAQAVKACGGKKIGVLGLVYQYVDPTTRSLFCDIVDIRDSGVAIVDKIVRAASYSSKPCEPTTDRYELTKRETTVLIEVAKGLTNKEIANKLNVSTYTVISHRKNIVSKTGIKSVAGLTVYALLNNLIDENVLE